MKYSNNVTMKQFNNEKSFTLIEIIIAITVLGMGIFSVIAVAGKSYGAISLQKNKLIAINLAREGMDTIRSVRDENWLYRGNSDCNGNGAITTCDGTGLCGDGVTPNETQICEDGGDCDWRCGNEEDNPPLYQPNFILNQNLRDIDYTRHAITGAGPFNNCTDTTQSVLLRIDANDFYQHTNGPGSAFRRLIIINRASDLNGDGNSNNDFQVRVIVCWRERGGRWYEISIEDHLYNWAH